MDFSDYPNDVIQFQLSGRKLLQKHQELHSVSFGYSGASELSIFISFTPPIPERSGRKPKTYARPSDFPEAFRKLPIVGENRLAGAQTTAGLAVGARLRDTGPIEARTGYRCGPGEWGVAPEARHSRLHRLRQNHRRADDPEQLARDERGDEPGLAAEFTVEEGMPPSVENICGRVTRTCVDLDCAVASVIRRTTDSRMLGLGVVPRQAKLPELDDPVVKFGAGNNRSYGVVKRIGIVRMNFGGAFADILIPCCQIERDQAVEQLDDEYQTRELVRPGDSGLRVDAATARGPLGGKESALVRR